MMCGGWRVCCVCILLAQIVYVWYAICVPEYYWERIDCTASQTQTRVTTANLSLAAECTHIRNHMPSILVHFTEATGARPSFWEWKKGGGGTLTTHTRGKHVYVASSWLLIMRTGGEKSCQCISGALKQASCQRQNSASRCGVAVKASEAAAASTASSMNR